MIGAKLTPFFYGLFTLINKARSRSKVFEPFEDSLKISSIIDTILISYGFLFISDQVGHL
ncbi:putative Hantavirus glycoprotein G1 [Prochlorococcus marinus str. MIT 9201]|uniref:Putative Hantavirus glycoprotein G1 n=1 Tax=Prochlorococcus marinus str. MIT 9201 TaxID=93057 RepID=A0A0A2A5Q7_PROMR|nr:putative Hantavirus glycoprotein G1 [Prochlorococcus marinus str. MIT 9201]